MALANRISIVIGIHNLGHTDYWSKVLALIDLPMTPKLRKHLNVMDKKKETKRKYQARIDVKNKRSKDNHEKIKTLIKKQIEDAKRGATYRSGMAVEDIIPVQVVRFENEMRERKEVKCKLHGCRGKSHSSNRSKQCTYHGCKTKAELRSKMDSVLRNLYPDHYGESRLFVDNVLSKMTCS